MYSIDDIPFHYCANDKLLTYLDDYVVHIWIWKIMLKVFKWLEQINVVFVAMYFRNGLSLNGFDTITG